MAKPQHPIEMAIQRFDESVKLYFNQIEKSLGKVGTISPPKQKKQQGLGMFESAYKQTDKRVL